jgi:hypothetical protein
MATKIKHDNMPEFKSVDRDIREHDWSADDFDLSFTDSTCPFSAIVEEVRTPDMEYMFALNNPERIDRLMVKKWVPVDPSRLANKQTFTQARKNAAIRDCITTGDTLLLERHIRYGNREREFLQQKNNVVMNNTVSGLVQTDIRQILSPFQDKY